MGFPAVSGSWQRGPACVIFVEVAVLSKDSRATNMKRKVDALRRGLKAAGAAMQSRKYSLAGKPIRCHHCHGETFDSATALLNTAGMTLLNLDWANRSATTLVCQECGHVQWFLKTPDKRID